MKVINTILFIHGFNSGPGDKVEQLKERFPNFEIIAPQLTYDVDEDLINLKKGISSKKNVHIIGSSLGCYYALILKNYIEPLYNDQDIIYYLINPSLKPYQTLSKYLNQTLENYKTGNQFTVTQEFLDDLEYYKDKIPNFSNTDLNDLYFFISENDEVINHKPLLESLKKSNKPYNLKFSKQNHKFSDISDVISSLKNNLIF